jgi:phage terminase Nu1 subunit (DNA packaging protein)
MSLESTSWFSEKTGFTRETVAKRLRNAGILGAPGERASTLYETKDALPVLYGQAEGGEQGDLMKARTENLEADTALKRLKEQQLLGELAPIDVLEWALSSVCAQISATLETLPAKLKRRLPQLNAADLEIIRKEIAKTRNAAAAARIDFGDGHQNANSEPDSAGDHGIGATATAQAE